MAVLCSVDVAVIIFGHNKKLYEYSSCDMHEALGRYQYVGDTLMNQWQEAIANRCYSSVAHMSTKAQMISPASATMTTRKMRTIHRLLRICKFNKLTRPFPLISSSPVSNTSTTRPLRLLPFRTVSRRDMAPRIPRSLVPRLEIPRIHMLVALAQTSAPITVRRRHPRRRMAITWPIHLCTTRTSTLP